jgi:peroxiredoxin
MSDSPAGQVRVPASRPDAFVLALLALSLAGNVALGVAISRLAVRVGNAPQVQSAAPAGPVVGQQLPSLTAERRGGGKESIAFAATERPTLIYVFTPSCTWCARNLANIRQVIAEAGKTHRVIGISLDPDVDAYEERVHLGIPIYVRPSRQTFEALRLGSTPQTIVLSGDGKVVKSWVGAYTGGTEREVASYFKVTLPGLIRETASVRTASN